MGKKKIIANFSSYKSSLKSCPRVKVKALRNIRHMCITEGKVYNLENNTPNGYWILNDKGELIRMDKHDFDMLNNGVPIKDEDLQVKPEDKQTKLAG